MHGPINVKSPKNTSKWQMGFNSAFKGLTVKVTHLVFFRESEFQELWLILSPFALMLILGIAGRYQY
jgi:hypothetical protein